MIKKVLAFCVREKENKYEILVLSKINGKGTEVPGGSVEEGESLEESVKRELFEETGIDFIKDIHHILTIPFHAEWRGEWQERNIFKVELKDNIKDEWVHEISDGVEDKGKKAKICWLDSELAKKELLWGQGAFIDEVLNN